MMVAMDWQCGEKVMLKVQTLAVTQVSSGNLRYMRL